ncbi:TetR family transcriptional regulator [Streptomyces sp. NPDC092370]|uniref:TetR family transcriptional regulator n=1 Tax=Streptomyces sp. NPDC092370 TaxID=3366016 RepID=UPI0038116F28
MKEVIGVAKQARALRTHDRVLDAAAYQFARFGYADTNLQHIADRIGLTKGALYGHFSSKEELAAALTEHLSLGVRALLDMARTSSGPALSRLEALVLGLGELFRTDRRAQAALRLEVEAARAAGSVAPVLTETHEVALQLVGEAQRAGLWDDTLPTDPLADLIMAALFTAFWASADSDRGRPGPSLPALWDVLARTLGTGVTA